MSGINEIKKKAKMSIDEMYDTQSVGKLDSQKDVKPEVQQTIQTAIQKENNPENHPTNNPVRQEVGQPLNHITGQTTNQQSGNLGTHLEQFQDFQVNRQTSIFPTAKQQTQKIPTYKMTFNLTEDIYKAFNDLYAQRMLQGRKTEKSELICEAVQWLIKMEEKQSV